MYRDDVRGQLSQTIDKHEGDGMCDARPGVVVIRRGGRVRDASTTGSKFWREGANDTSKGSTSKQEDEKQVMC